MTINLSCRRRGVDDENGPYVCNRKATEEDGLCDSCRSPRCETFTDHVELWKTRRLLEVAS